MSVAVAVLKDGELVIATDSLESFGSHVEDPQNLRIEKIIQIGPSYLAHTGWGLYENILEDVFARHGAPKLTDKQAIFSFFLQLWQVLHDEYAFVNDQCDEEESPFGALDASFLIVNPNGIFCVSTDMRVAEYAKYVAIGSGQEYAYGALHALYDEEYDAEAIARKAVQACTAQHAFCGGEPLVRKLRVK